MKKRRKSVQISADSPTANKERMKLHKEIYDFNRTHRKGIKYITDEQLKTIAFLQHKWDETHAIAFEKLIAKPFNLYDFKQWYDSAAPAWKEIKAAEGNRVCKAYGCMEILPQSSSPLREYHSDKCRERERNRNRDKGGKAASNIRSYGKKYIEQKGHTEEEVNAAVNALRDYNKSKRECS